MQQKTTLLFTNALKIVIALLLSSTCLLVTAQHTGDSSATDTTKPKIIKRLTDKDIIDELHHWSHKDSHPHAAERQIKANKYNLSFVPAVGYTLQTGFAGIASVNVGYYNDEGPNAKISSLSTSITYSQYNQVIVPLFVDIWSKGEKYNLVSDNRFISYPSDIYGLGGRTDPNRGHTIDFNSIKLHETFLIKLTKKLVRRGRYLLRSVLEY